MKTILNKPWLRIWTHPRETIRAIVRKNPKSQFVLLSGIYGFPLVLQQMQCFSMGQNLPIMAIVLISLILAFLLGMLGITIMTALLQWTGKWIGGSAPFYNIRAAVTWSSVPTLGVTAIWLLLMSVFGGVVFLRGFQMMPFTGGFMGFLMIANLLQLLFAVWAFVVLLCTLSEVQKFPIWKAFLNVVISGVIIGVIGWLFSVVFFGTAGTL